MLTLNGYYKNYLIPKDGGRVGYGHHRPEIETPVRGVEEDEAFTRLKETPLVRRVTNIEIVPVAMM